MSLARAIETGDLSELPSRREEDWRWTDLRGLLRNLPPAAPVRLGVVAAGPFDEIAETIFPIVNGRGPAFIDLAAGERRAVALRIVAADPGSSSFSLGIRLAAGAQLLLFESHEGSAPAVCDFRLEVDVAAGARLERVLIADQAAETISVTLAKVRLGERAEFVQTIAASGARRQRIETEVCHSRGSTARLDGLYLVGDRRHVDLTTRVIHAAPDASTDQLAKGLAAGQGRAVFQGRVTVESGADGADAAMGHHALLLSPRAEVDAKPELEIFAEDVACSHGNSIGALDGEALFYAGQRGITEAEARAMLTHAFLAEVVGRVTHGGARGIVEDWLAEQIERLV